MLHPSIGLQVLLEECVEQIESVLDTPRLFVGILAALGVDEEFSEGDGHVGMAVSAEVVRSLDAESLALLVDLLPDVLLHGALGRAEAAPLHLVEGCCD